MNTTTKIQQLTIRANKHHDDVCDVHYDRSRMNADGTCAECQDDLHEAEILG